MEKAKAEREYYVWSNLTDSDFMVVYNALLGSCF